MVEPDPLAGKAPSRRARLTLPISLGGPSKIISASRSTVGAWYAQASKVLSFPSRLPVKAAAFAAPRYGAEDAMPFSLAFLAALQFVGITLPYIAYPLAIVREASVPEADAISVMSLSFVAMALAVAAQAWQRIGPGYVVPVVFTAAYLGPTAMAARMGGWPLVCGMMLFAGAVEMILAFRQRWLQAIMSPQISGLIMTLIGLSIIDLVSANLLRMAASGGYADWVVMLVEFGSIVLLTLRAKGRLASFSILVGLGIGCLLALTLGVIPLGGTTSSQPFMALPSIGHLGLTFSLELAPAFLLAALASGMRAMATVAGAGRAGAALLVPLAPEVEGRRSMLADGLGSLLAGVLGTIGVNPAPAVIVIVRVTGLASRLVAWLMTALLLVLALLPAVALAVLSVPAPIVAGLLLFSGSLVLANGLQTIASGGLDTHNALIIGAGMLGVPVAKGLAAQVELLPQALAPMLTSTFTLAVGLAILVHLAIRLTAHRQGQP